MDSGRSIAEVARELGVMGQSLGAWVRDERRRIEAAKGTELEPSSGAERAGLLRLRKKVAVQERDLAFLGKAAASIVGQDVDRQVQALPGGVSTQGCRPDDDADEVISELFQQEGLAWRIA